MKVIYTSHNFIVLTKVFAQFTGYVKRLGTVFGYLFPKRNDVFYLSLILILFFLPFPVMPSDQWQSVRQGQEGRGTIRYDGAKSINEWHYMYKTGRRYKPGLAVWASPAIAVVAGNPMAFIGGYDQTLHALDITEKRVVWRKITNAPISSTPAIAKVGGLDTVFWGSSDRTVYANTAFNGNTVWTKELIPASSTLGEADISSPYIDGERLYISCFAYDKALARNRQKGSLYCLDIKTGNIIWNIDVSSGFLSSPVGFKAGGKLHIAICARKGLIQCFDVSSPNPKLSWSYQMPHEVFASPVVSDDDDNPILFIGSKFGNLVAVDAKTGRELWSKMAGNWIDNCASIGKINGKKVVFVGSHDYFVYAFEAESGKLLWKKAVGGEIYSAPCFFNIGNTPYITVASLDNHLYVIDAETGIIANSYFTGQPIWDKIPKGEMLWGSPAVIESGGNTAIVHGAFSDIVYVIPLVKECSLTAMARSVASLWVSLFVVFIIFCGIVMPIVISIPLRKK